MTGTLRLETAEAVVELLPALGGAVAAFDLTGGGERLPVFRRRVGASANPRSFASSPILPWFNRISGGGFRFGGRFHPVAPNDPQDPFPLHGDGWLSPWDVVEADAGRVVLRLRSRAVPPFDYEAQLVYALDGSTLETQLSVTHCGAEPLPYGLGQHPWLPRSAHMQVSAPATGMWLAQPPDFPDSPVPDRIPESWDFSTPRPLPAGFVDNGYAGWNGRARIAWQDRGLALDIAAGPEVRFFHVYTLNAACPFFCFEPVTHPNNALAKPGTPEENGLRILQAGESTSLTVAFAAARI